MRYLGAELAADREPGWHLRGRGGNQDLDVGCEINWSSCVASPITDEATVQAACGLMAVHGRQFGGPRLLPLGYASVAAGVIAAQGVLAAILGQLRGIPAGHVHTTVAQAALLTVGQYLAAETAPHDQELDRVAADRPGPPFRSSDGVWFEIEALDSAPWQRFWQAMGVEQPVLGRAWRTFLTRYATAMCPLPTVLHEATTQRTFDETVTLAQSAGMAICRVRSPLERRADIDGLAGEYVPPPWILAPSTPAGITLAPGTGLPLDGLTVVESTRRVQGPLAANLLRMLGAKVVRIEQPGGDPLRQMPPVCGGVSARFDALNRDKTVVEVDLKSAAGRDEVLDLVRSADVFLHNWAPGKAGQFGLDEEDLRAVAPGIVYGYASGWGDHPPAGNPPGTDFMVQAHSGLSSVIGTAGAPRTSLMTLVDVMGGLITTEGIVAGLLGVAQSGRGVRVDTSLMRAASVIEYAHLEDNRRGAVRGCSQAPESFGCDILTTAAGVLAVSAGTATHTDRLKQLLGLAPDSDLALIRESLEDVCRSAEAAALQEKLSSAGIPSHVVCEDLADIPRNPELAACLEQRECAFAGTPWRFES
ncbi:CoA transferase [Actinocrispum sp. NPDC049592]|uniref:CoA transferase n=1 Tax=Actinocrispum sp. NPDC049592 TaxID=3154835 RepID=UPI00342916D9